jgi:hypothetical protein
MATSSKLMITEAERHLRFDGVKVPIVRRSLPPAF